MKIGSAALLRDKHGNEYSEEAMLLALLLKAKGKQRGSDEEEDIRKLLNDPNIKGEHPRR